MVLAVIAATGFVIVETVSSSQLRQVDQQLSAALPAALSFGQPPILGLPRTRPALTQREDVNGIYIALISHGRRSVLLSPLLTKGEAPRVPPVAQTPRIGKLAPQSVSSETGSSRWRADLLQSPRSSNNVLIAVSLTGVDTTASRLRWSVLGAGLIVLVVLLSGGFWVERLGLRPIAEVANVADSIVAGDRSRRVTNSASGTEAAHLADAFNVMLDEQHATEDRLRQFLADASHELRTPVTVIRGLADMWASGDLREGPDLADGMRRIGQEAARMSRLVQELLLLARLDSGPPLDAVPVDMRELINNAISIAAATHPNRSVTSAIAGSGIVEGDEEALGQVIRNLIANALTHTSPTSPIEVRFANADG
ncbi:MAG: HAMP domain-containing sensor histidine kinase, partial [Nitrososphaerales archaeon]